MVLKLVRPYILPLVTISQASAVDLNAVPWSVLGSDLVSGAGVLSDSSPEDYVAQCLPTFLNPDPSAITTYDLIDQPSGLCMNAYYCAFNRCCPEESLIDKDSKANLSEVIGSLKSLGYGAPRLNTWNDASNPMYNLPYKVLFPEVAGDVVAAVLFANEHNFAISVKASGHSYTGASTKKDTLLINMNKYKKYATNETGVFECAADNESSSSERDGSSKACRVAISRNKGGVLRVGGGQNWDETYRAVKSYNDAQAQYRYHVIGGNSATVTPMGWTWSGGLSGTTAGRLFGLGVDQVIQIEAVLPNGQHVRFGPSDWTAAEGYLVPKTTAVEGECNANPKEPDESKWTWGECSVEINFDDLWFAFRGGGGGTWGVVLSTYLQLHNYYPFEFVQPTDTCAASQLLYYPPIDSLLTKFNLEYFLDPESVSVTKEVSNACGSAAGPTHALYFCYGEGMGDAYVSAYKSFMSTQNETLAALGYDETHINIVNECFQVEKFKDFAEMGLMRSWGKWYEGRLADDGYNTPWSNFEGLLNILVPKDWILQNKDKMVEMMVKTGMRSGANYYAFGDTTAVSHDQTSSLSVAHRTAGAMFLVSNDGKHADGFVDWNSALQEMYDFSGDEFPAYIGANHLSSDLYGPLRTDWTKPCPMSFTFRESEEQCVSAQTAVWGSENLQRLEAIKKEIDPDGMFDCFRCVGNKWYSEAETTTTVQVSETTESKTESTMVTTTDVTSVSSALGARMSMGFGGFFCTLSALAVGACVLIQ